MHPSPLAPVRTTSVAFAADDGSTLHGTLFHPPGRTVGAAVVAGAMATPSRTYAAFAAWLAAHGRTTLTFDYGGSLDPGGAADRRADALTWSQDAACALEHLAARHPDVPLTWIGHSFGGQVLPFVRHDLLDQVVLVAAASGYWRWLRPRARWAAPLVLRVLVPIATRAGGHFPGARLGVVGDLPTGVMRQWSRWCLSPAYYGIDVARLRDRTAQVTAPILAVSIADDELVTARSHRELEALFTYAPIERWALGPDEADVPRIGHGGFFRPAMRATWESGLLPRLPRA